jgi:hypothetical protein
MNERTGGPVVRVDWLTAVANEVVRVSEQLWKHRLDFSGESLRAVDMILDRLRARKKPDLGILVNALGCYAGEVFARQINGRWILDESGGPVVEVLDVGIVNPIGKCWKRFQNGEADSVDVLYRLIVALRGQSGAEGGN